MFYEVSLNGRVGDVDVVNILHYRDAPGTNWLGFTLNGAEEVATRVYEDIWKTRGLNVAVSYSMQDQMNVAYSLQNVTVIPRNSTFQLIYQLPFILAVNEPGLAAGNLDGAARTATMRYNLEPTPIQAGFVAPKYGYSRIGPIPTEAIDANGNFVSSYLDSWNATAGRFAQDLWSLTAQTWVYPIRLKTHYVAGLPVLDGYADVTSAVFNSRVGWLDSRAPRG